MPLLADMTDSSWIAVAMAAITVIGGGGMTTVALFINRKFDSKVSTLEQKHAACEESHAACEKNHAATLAELADYREQHEESARERAEMANRIAALESKAAR